MTVTNATRTPSFTFISNENANFKCAIDDTRLYQNCGEGMGGKFIARNVPDGRHAFFVQGTDKYGNAGQHVQYIFTVGESLFDIFLYNENKEKIIRKRRYSLFDYLKR